MNKKIKLKPGKDIILEKGERILTYRNKVNGTIYYSTTKYDPILLDDGQVFQPIFERPTIPSQRRIKYIKLDSLERLYL